MPDGRVFLFVPKYVWRHSGSPESGGLTPFCEAKDWGERYPVCEVETSVWWVDSFPAHPGSLMSVAPMSVVFPEPAGGAKAEEALSSFGVAAAVKPGI